MERYLSKPIWSGIVILLFIAMGGGAVGCALVSGPLLPDRMLTKSGGTGSSHAMNATTNVAVREYVLQAGDEIDIQVYREPDLSGTFKINSTGDIRHSLVGSVPMAGKTVEEAEAFFTQKLAKDYLVNPRIVIKLVSTQGSQIVVMGEVEKPGVYPLPPEEPMTLLQAIAVAGGFTELASPDRVRIVRRTLDGHQTTLKVRVSELLDGRGKQQDIPLAPNDVIMVPEVVF